MLIGELAKAAGVNVQTVRYYERIGLLRPDHRSASGYRHYGAPAVTRLRKIKQAQRLGFTLAEVRAALDGRDAAPTAAALRSSAEKKAAELQRRIDDLRAVQRTLLRELERCGCDTGKPCTFVTGAA